MWSASLLSACPRSVPRWSPLEYGCDVRDVYHKRRSWTGHISARIGEKVIWRNPTFTPHNVKSYNQGKRWRLQRAQLETNNRNQVVRRFKKRGNYYFRCTLHSFSDGNGGYGGMVGIVRVRR